VKNNLYDYSKIKAIVIDDDQNTTSVFCEFLDLMGIKVLGEGHSGKEALDLFKTKQPNVVFLDVMMPLPYDGIYALERIREMNKDVVVIMVTADLRFDTEKKLNALNASAIIYKPFEMEKILETVRSLLPQYHTVGTDAPSDEKLQMLDISIAL
jgi:two-component system, chemotaxis family, chemotaxis protein CheY